jgi:membrane fusion protein (multidrug efflux system)
MRAATIVLTAVLAMAGTTSAAPPRKVVATSPRQMDVAVAERYAGRLRAHRHIEIRALLMGYIEEVTVKEGQAVKKDDVLFKTTAALLQARLQADQAEVQIARIELANTKKLFESKVVSKDEVAPYVAKLDRALAKAKLTATELSFTMVKAPFDGLVGNLTQQLGSLVKEGDALTTLSDASTVWAYFNVPEARYLEFMRRDGESKDRSHLVLPDSRIELELADGKTFDHVAGNSVTLMPEFNSGTGTIALRADFPNPKGLLRHGQTGTLLIRRPVKNAIVIPQRATFEILDRRYVYVIGKDDVVHPREIVVEHEIDNLFVIKKGLETTDRIVLEHVQRVQDGDKVEYELLKPEIAIPGPKVDRKE